MNKIIFSVLCGLVMHSSSFACDLDFSNTNIVIIDNGGCQFEFYIQSDLAPGDYIVNWSVNSYATYQSASLDEVIAHNETRCDLTQGRVWAQVFCVDQPFDLVFEETLLFDLQCEAACCPETNLELTQMVQSNSCEMSYCFVNVPSGPHSYYTVWDFGDGQEETCPLSSICHSHQYDCGGLYEIKVDVYCDDNDAFHEQYALNAEVVCDEQCCPQFEVNQEWNIRSRAEGPGLCDVRFSIQGYEPIDGVLRQWNFGDGYPEPGVYTPSTHVFSEDGPTEVCVRFLCADNPFTILHEICTTIDVNCSNACQLHDVSFQYNQSGRQTDFSPSYMTGEGAQITGADWDFGDGTDDEGLYPTHYYDAPGDYEVCVTLYAQDEESGQTCSFEYCEVINIGCSTACEVFPRFIPIQEENCEFYFQNVTGTSLWTSVEGYSWDFGDGNYSNEVNPTHTFAEPGEYEVCLTSHAFSNGSHCSKEFCFTIETECTPNCHVTAAYNYQTSDCTVSFNNISGSTQGENEYLWTFDDGTTSTEMNPIHEFPSSGSYEVCLQTTELLADGITCVDHTCRIIEINCPVPCVANAEFEWNFDQCFFQFIDVSTTLDASLEISEWNWNFGDGSFSNEQNPDHTFNENGVYEVCLSINVNNEQSSCQFHICKEVEVMCEDPCNFTPKFDYYPIEDCQYQLYNLTEIPSGYDVIGMEWFLDDNSVGMGESIDVQFSGNGTREVCLEITISNGSEKCVQTYCELFEVECGCACEQFQPNFLIQNHADCSVSFTDLSDYGCLEIVQRKWILSDGFVTDSPNFSHYFSSFDEQEACLYLEVSDGQNYCEFYVCEQVLPCSESEAAPSPITPGTGSLENSPEVNVFPNPSADVVRIQSDDIIREIQFHDSMGRILLSEKIENRVSELDVSQLKNGTYIVSILTNDGVISKRLIVEH